MSDSDKAQPGHLGEKGAIAPRNESSPRSARASGDPQIFVCDATAETGRLLSALLAKGYSAVDVPLGLLPNRVNYEVPKLVICDAEAHEAKRRLKEMNEATSAPIALLLIGHLKGNLDQDAELKALSTKVLWRPLVLDDTIEEIARIVGKPRRGTHRPRVLRATRAPLIVESARRPYRSDGRPPSSSEHPTPDLELSWPTDSPPSRGPFPTESVRSASEASPSHHPTTRSSSPPSSGQLRLSSDTQTVLEEGRRRVVAYAKQAPRPVRLPMADHSEGGDIDPEFVKALSEPLDASIADAVGLGAREATSSGDEFEGAERPTTKPSGKRDKSEEFTPVSKPTNLVRPPAPSGADREERTNPGGKSPTGPPGSTGFPAPSPAFPPPPLDDLSDLLGPADYSTKPEPSRRRPQFAPIPEINLESEHPPNLAVTIPPPLRPKQTPQRRRPTPVARPDSEAPPTEGFRAPNPRADSEPARESMRRVEEPPSQKAPALRWLARAIRERSTGAIAQQDQGGLRRIVLTDGDISTVASTIESESLAHYLRAKGDLSEAALSELGAMPGFGRHAGAALVARGFLQQEDLWPVLRAHAEWVLRRALLSSEDSVLERRVPARVLEEPAVFGGAAGTEIYLESVRRVVAPEYALQLLGGAERILGIGRHEALLGESALTADEQKRALGAVGLPLGPLLAKDPELLPLLAGLVELGVLTAGTESLAPPKPHLQTRSREMDEQALTARVRARLALVDDGDYFAILGVAHSATGYEVGRAAAELLKEFSEERLTAGTVHLQKDLEQLRATIEEAALVLSDDVRRMRYRMAIEAVPA